MTDSDFNLAVNRPYPYPYRVRSSRSAFRERLYITLLTYLLILYPTFGMFYPLESYLGSGTQDTALPLPVTSISLVLISLSIIYYYFLVRARDRVFVHNYPMYAFVLLAFASMMWAHGYSMWSFQRALRLLPAIGLGVVLAQYYSLERMLRILVIAFLISAVVSVIMAVGFPQLGISRIGGAYENAWRGASLHKNGAGNLFAIGVFVICYAVFLRVVTMKFAFLALIPCGLMLAKADSATALVSLAAVFASFVPMSLIRLFEPRLRPVLLLTLAVSTIFVALLVLFNMDAIFQMIGRDPTFTGRSTIWAAVWGLIQQQPLTGYGYGLWTTDTNVRRIVWAAVGDTAAHSHNSWLDIWLQIGFFGFLFFLGGTLLALWRSITGYVRTNDRRYLFYFALLIYMLIRSNTEVQFTDPLTTCLFWMAWVSTKLKMDR